MDWERIVSQLARTRPAVVVDPDRRVQFVNGAMSRVLGRDGEEVVGRDLLLCCVPKVERAAVRTLLDDGFSGAATDGEIKVLGASGERVALRVALRREGTGRSRALVVVADGVSEQAQPGLPCDCMLEVSRADGRAGTVVAARFLDPAADGAELVGRPIGAALEMLGLVAVDGMASAILQTAEHTTRVLLPDGDRVFRVVATGAVDGGETVRVTVRCIDSRILPDLVDAKVARIAEAGGLSERERQVLRLLLRGRGVEDIATILEIAPRTVKFHQANVLQKLGADSRLDLLRVVL